MNGLRIRRFDRVARKTNQTIFRKCRSACTCFMGIHAHRPNIGIHEDPQLGTFQTFNIFPGVLYLKFCDC